MTKETETDDEIEYRLSVSRQLWKDIKATVSQAESLNDTLVERLRRISFGARYTRKADSRGRISLPDDEYAGKEVEVLVMEAGDE